MRIFRSVLFAVGLIAIGVSRGAAQDATETDAAAVPLPSPHATTSPLPHASPAPEPVTSPGAAGSTGAVPPAIVLPPGMTAGALQTQSVAAFMRGAQRYPGAIDLVRKDDELYFDLGPQSFERTFIVAPSLASGVGGEAFAGRVYEPFLVSFKRVGKRVLWISPNARYVARAGSAQARSLAISVADSVLASTPIVAEDSAHEHVIIAPSILLSDLEGIGADLGRSGAQPSTPGLVLTLARPSYALDATKSYYGTAKAFPRNDEISVNLTFSGPPNALLTVPDGRGIPLVVHYSIVAPADPDPAFMPRYADDRVGYFITARKRYDDDALASPFERFIDRWNFDRGPLTFYLTGEVPAQYRATVRRALLTWNDALARAGRANAILVKDAPADPDWDPEDIRYSVVRWITSDRSSFSAYSPTVVDPRSGEILRAEVVIDGESLRAVKRGYTTVVAPTRRLDAGFGASASEPQSDPLCTYAQDSLTTAALGAQLMATRGHATPLDREAYAQKWLFATVLHETGHTLGLRHNFAGSTAYTSAQLHDPRFTAAHGTTASVMDYTPVNLALPGRQQADYFPTRLGPYDYWAIQYGYERFANVHSPAEERPYLDAIAGRSTTPVLRYGTDEDAVEPLAVDPHVARFDLSSDPLGYDRDMLALDESLATTLDRPYPGDTRSYDDLRAAMVTILNDELASIDLTTAYLGGIYTSRDHRGQPGAGPPLRAIDRAQQRRAFEVIDRYVFSSRAFQYRPALLNELVIPRYGLHWGAGDPRRPDFPLREVVAEIQDDAISTLFSATNLARIADQSLKTEHPGRTMSLADLFAWSNGAIFDDLGAPTIQPLHRELQRRFADLEMQIALLPSFVLDSLALPREIQSLAHLSLVGLHERLPAAQRAARDPGTRAHLADLSSRVGGALAPQTARPL